MKGLKTITIVLVGFMFQSNINAQNKLNSYFDHLYANKKMMGSVAISLNDSIIYKKAIGYSNTDLKINNDTETKFRIGSITKTFTAVLVMRAIEEKLITLDTKLNAYYPQIKNAEKITVELLLKHRTGIYNFTEIQGANEWEQKPHTEKEFIDSFVNEKSNFEPGAEFEYSNTNYALLGFILQKVYRKAYSEILEEKITKPLKLKNTGFTLVSDNSKNEALSYNIQDQYIRNEVTNFSTSLGSGGMYSTPTDLNKFLFALFNGKLITKESLQTMLPKEKGEYGMGIEKLPFKNPEGYAHTGRIENYISDYWYFTDENIGIVSLANAANFNTTDAMDTMLLYLYKQEPKLPNFNAITELGEKEFLLIKGTYLLEKYNYTITISSDGKNAFFQDSRAGQMFVPLVYKGNNIFECDDIKLKFVTEKKEMLFQQGDVKLVFKKK